jgi:hypothetical protein
MTSWGGDHPDGPEPSRESQWLGLVLAGMFGVAALVCWVLLVAGLV